MKTDGKTLYFQIEGIFCIACISIIEDALNSIEGIMSANINYATSILTVKCNNTIDIEKIIKQLKKKGYDCKYIENIANKDTEDNLKIKRKKITLIFILSIFLVHNPWYIFSGIIQFIFTTLIILIVGKDLYKNALFSLSLGKTNMSVLIMFATMSAYLYSSFVVFFGSYFGINQFYFEATGSVLVFVSISSYLENTANLQATEQLYNLTRIIPKIVKKSINGVIIDTAITEIKKDDILVINAGEVIPVDSIIIKGHSQIDDSTLTGESTYKEKKEGDNLYASSINFYNEIYIRASGRFKDSLFSKVVNEAFKGMGQSNSPIQENIDHFSSVFLALIILLSIIAFFLWYCFFDQGNLIKSLTTAISILIVACPCTMALSVSMCMNIAIVQLSRDGILVKGHYAIEQMAKINVICFDKTGTLTSSEMKSVNIQINDNFNKEEIIKLVTNIESSVNHPIAKAINKKYGKGNTDNINNFKYEFGELRAQIGEIIISIKPKCQQMLENQQSDIYINGIYAGKIISNEKLRSGSCKIIEILKKCGFRILILSGDNRKAVENIANKLGIKEYKYNLLPHQKSKIIFNLKKENSVMMVGDGVNDLTAMEKANVSVAIGQLNDVIASTADIIITKNKIMHLLKALYVSKNTYIFINKAIKISIIYNIVAVFLAFSGILTPLVSASLMSISSLTSILIARKLKSVINIINFANILDVYNTR